MTKWITRIAWILLILDLILMFPASRMRITGNAVGPILMVLWLIISLFVVCTWLLIYYRKFFQQWWGWNCIVIMMIVSSYITQGAIPVRYPPLELLWALLAILSVWGTVLVTALLLLKHDVGISLLAWASVILTWLVALGWRVQGNLLAIAFNSLSTPDQLSPLWWIYPFLLLFGIILLASLISFVGHTIRLISLEFRRPTKRLLPPPLVE